MKEKIESMECCDKKMMYKRHRHWHGDNNQPGAIYGLGVVGALFYFLQNATTLGLVLIGILKAIFWPAFLLFRILTDLRM